MTSPEGTTEIRRWVSAFGRTFCAEQFPMNLWLHHHRDCLKHQRRSNHSPSPWGEGRGEGGHILFPQGLEKGLMVLSYCGPFCRRSSSHSR
jgi:hypothetical protein